MKKYRAKSGFTLIELLVTLAVLAIIASISMPAFFEMIDRGHLKALTESVYSDLQFARSESLKQNRTMVVSFDTATWCYGINEDASCDCTAANACQVNGVNRDVQAAAYAGASLSAVSFGGDAFVSFEPVRGTTNSTSAAQSVTVTSTDGLQLRVNVNLLGRISVCYPGTAVAGYDSC